MCEQEVRSSGVFSLSCQLSVLLSTLNKTWISRVVLLLISCPPVSCFS